MCRMMVAIILGGNFGGAAWQREQLDRNLFSPSRLIAPSCAVWLAETAGAPLSFFASSVLAAADKAKNIVINTSASETADPRFTLHLRQAKEA